MRHDRWHRSVFATLFLYEIRMLVRDTRMILIAIVLPLVLFPALIVTLRTVEQREERRLEQTTYRYALVGDRAEWARPVVARALRSESVEPDSDGPAVRFLEQEGGGTADSLLAAGEVHVLIQALSPEAAERREAHAEVGAAPPDTTAGRATSAPATPVLRLEYRGRSDLSRNAMERLRGRLEEVRAEIRDSAYRAGGFPVEPAQVAAVEAENAASAEREGGALLGLVLTPFLLFLMLSGGSIAAVDAISGEKERGTLETLLTTAATRSEIVLAKQLAIIVVGLVVAVVNVLNLLVYLVLGVFELPEGLSVALSPLDLVLLLMLFLPLTVLVSSALLLLSGYARSYKEYQIFFFPVFLIFLAPSLAGMLPGMDLRSAVAFVPVAGVGVAVREILVGEYDWLFLVVAFGSSGAAALWLARLTVRALSTERLIGGVEFDAAELFGGPALFPRRVLRWFAALWVAFFVVSLWFGEALGLRGQILVNLVVIFLGGSLWMVRHYRLVPREAFALRLPHPAVWLAVIVGAPAGYVVGLGIATFVNTHLFPVPRDLVEAFGDVMLGADLPLWQLVALLALLPGVLEELTFRGVLLHGLRARLGPVATCLAVGAIFGLFHVSLFRIVPTAYLGVLLAAVVLLTGSVFPAMAWHALNNALALVPAHQGWVDVNTELPGWTAFLGLVGLGVCFAILWKVRRPYPGWAGARVAARESAVLDERAMPRVS